IAHGIAHPFDLAPMASAECARESRQDAIGAVREHAISEAGDGVLFMQPQRLRSGNTHQCAGKRREAAEAQHDVRRMTSYDAAALPGRAHESERSQHELAQSLAAHAAERHALEHDAMLRYELRLHSFTRAEPEHAPPARVEI